jgi:hypothetical protein
MTLDRIGNAGTVRRTDQSAARQPSPAQADATSISLGMPIGEFLHFHNWTARRGNPATGVDLTDPATRPTVRAAPSSAPADVGMTASPSGVSPAGIVTGRRTSVAAEAGTKTATSINHFDGIAWAGQTTGNGQRDTTVLMPIGLDLSRPIEVITFFHGNGGSAAASTRELKALVAKLPAHGRNAIIIIPTTPANKRDWMAPSHGESLTGLQDEGVRIAGQLAGHAVTVGSYTVEGFSGGGMPVATAAKAGQLRASKINLFDSTYGDWGDTAVKLRQPGAKVNVFYTEHNRERAMRLEGKPGVTLEESTTNHGGTPGKYFFR